MESVIYGKKQHTKESQILIDPSLDAQERLQTLLSIEREMQRDRERIWGQVL